MVVYVMRISVILILGPRFCEMKKNKKKKDNREQSVLIDSSELQSVTDYSKMCHCRSENVTQLLLISEAVMLQSNVSF